MKPELFSLCWTNFQPHLTTIFKELFTENNFADVTLVSDDQVQIPAHKIILSACSPILKNILLHNTHSHPLLYLRGVKQQELLSILKFVYLGEVTIHQEQVKKFLDVAKDLDIMGLSQNYTDEQTIEEASVENDDTNAYIIDTDVNEHRNETDVKDEPVISDIPVYTKMEGSDKTSYNCQDCELVFTSRNGRNHHAKSLHEGIRYSCNHCEYQATTQYSLKMHQETKHEGVRFSCDQCDYQATRKDTITKHKQYKHEGVKFSCNLCDHQATQQTHLIRHQRNKHEGVRFYCNQCDYNTGWKAYLRKHKTNKHN